MRSVGLPGDYSRCLEGLRRLRQLGSFGLSQDEPPRPVDEPHKDRSITIVSTVSSVSVRFCPPLERDGHAQRECFLALPDVASQFFPPGERGHRSRLQASGLTLEHRQELIAQAVAVKRVIGTR